MLFSISQYLPAFLDIFGKIGIVSRSDTSGNLGGHPRQVPLIYYDQPSTDPGHASIFSSRSITHLCGFPEPRVDLTQRKITLDHGITLGQSKSGHHFGILSSMVRRLIFGTFHSLQAARLRTTPPSSTAAYGSEAPSVHYHGVFRTSHRNFPRQSTRIIRMFVCLQDTTHYPFSENRQFHFQAILSRVTDLQQHTRQPSSQEEIALYCRMRDTIQV